MIALNKGFSIEEPTDFQLQMTNHAGFVCRSYFISTGQVGNAFKAGLLIGPHSYVLGSMDNGENWIGGQ